MMHHAIVFMTALLFTSLASAETFYVATNGSDNNSGTSISSPLKTINAALEKAYAGDYIKIAPGTYYQDIETVRSGTQNNPIRIRGNDDPFYSSSKNTIAPIIIHGAGNSRVVQIRHSHIELTDVTIDGLVGSPNKKSSYRNKLLYVHNDKKVSGLTNIVLKRLNLTNAGGECVRFRYRITHSTLSYSTITNCGVYDFKFNGGGKNGEGVYVGTALNQLNDGKNPTSDVDETSNNSFVKNTINTLANECIDLKPGTRFNEVKDNFCTGNRDGHSAGINNAGNSNRVEGNIVTGNFGAGIRIGSDDTGFGINNVIIGNKIYGNQGPGLKMISLDQDEICDNDIRHNDGGIASRTPNTHNDCLYF